MLLFVLMALSILWSIDPADSIKALSKELMLFAIPFCFCLFPALNAEQRQKIFGAYSGFMVVFAIGCLIRAAIRYLSGGGTAVFFYHELVSEKVNAIHVSLYFSLALLWFLIRGLKDWHSRIAFGLLLVCLILLSSKNILVVFALLAFSLVIRQKKIRRLLPMLGGLLAVMLAVYVFSGKASQRFSEEFSTVTTDNTRNENFTDGAVYSKSIHEAWSNETFSTSDYFPGTAMRVLQFRFFCEMLVEDGIFWSGYGLNASYLKISEKAASYHLHPQYGAFNFHNQYVQNFADLGIFGLLLLLLMLIISLKIGFERKDFLHISFTFLLISLFLTESFLWRQRGVTFFVAMYCLFNSGFGNFPARRKT